MEVPKGSTFRLIFNNGAVEYFHGNGYRVEFGLVTVYGDGGALVSRCAGDVVSVDRWSLVPVADVPPPSKGAKK